MRNNARILDAALLIADEVGWSAMTLASVAQRAGLSRQAAVSRYRDRSELAADLWTTRLAPPLADALAALTVTPTDVAALREAFVPFVQPDQQMRAAAELLVVARYDRAVADAIQATIGPRLDEWLSAQERRLTRAQAAQYGYLFCQAFGFLMQSRRFLIDPADLDGELAGLKRALQEPGKPRKLPADSLDYIGRPVEFGTGDPELEGLLRATLTEVGERGYEAATLDSIARAAGCTQGLIFSRYQSKQQMFHDASDRMMGTAVNAGNDFWRSVAQTHSEGIAQATQMRELMLPAHRAPRTVNLEQCRLSWHDEALLASDEKGFADAVWQIHNDDPSRSVTELRGSVYSGIALGFGVMVLADLYPTAWSLPFDVVTVPQMDGE